MSANGNLVEMSKKYAIAAVLLALLAFLIPIEYKYDKWFRFFSLQLIPDGLFVSDQYEKKIYFYISDFLAIALTFLGLVPFKKWFGHVLWIVWLCALFSIITSPFAAYPIPYFRLLQLFTPIALFAFIANVEKNYTQAIVHAIVFAGLLQTGIAIAQYFHQAPLGLRLLGEVNQTSIIYIPDGASRWFFDQLLERKADTTLLMRAAGTFPHANVFGGFMFFSIMATYFLAIKRRIWLFTLPLQFFAMALSYSRSALFAWTIASILWFGFMIYRKGVRSVAPIAAVMAFTLCGAAALLYHQYLHRGGVMNYNLWVQHSDHVRQVQQETGKKIVKDHSIFGVGFTQFSERSSTYLQGLPQYIRVTAPHNIFLFLACETGLISLGAFLLFLGNLFYRFLKSDFTPEPVLFFSLLSGFLFIGLCDFYPILFQQGKLMFFLIAASLVANTRKDVVKMIPAYERSIP